MAATTAAAGRELHQQQQVTAQAPVAEPPAATCSWEGAMTDAERRRLTRLRTFRRTHPQLSSQCSVEELYSGKLPPGAAATAAATAHLTAHLTTAALAAAAAGGGGRAPPVPPPVPYRPRHYACQLQPILRCGRVYHGTAHPSDAPPLFQPGSLPPDAPAVRVFVLNLPETSIRVGDAATAAHATHTDDGGGPFSLAHQRMLPPGGKWPPRVARRWGSGGGGDRRTRSGSGGGGGSEGVRRSYDVRQYLAATA